MKGVAATAMTAASYRRVVGANSRIGIAMIGVGRRGREVGTGLLGDPRAELLAICDIYDVQRTRAVAALKTSDSVKQLVAHEEALALAGVDAVVIAAPDHLHATLATAALAARKHVYLEKPTIHKWQERTQIAEALATSGTVLQCGTQQRSGAHYWRAKREIFDTPAVYGTTFRGSAVKSRPGQSPRVWIGNVFSDRRRIFLTKPCGMIPGGIFPSMARDCWPIFSRTGPT
jgi:predicted dehydrogenase